MLNCWNAEATMPWQRLFIWNRDILGNKFWNYSATDYWLFLFWMGLYLSHDSQCLCNFARIYFCAIESAQTWNSSGNACTHGPICIKVWAEQHVMCHQRRGKKTSCKHQYCVADLKHMKRYPKTFYGPVDTYTIFDAVKASLNMKTDM